MLDIELDANDFNELEERLIKMTEELKATKEQLRVSHLEQNQMLAEIDELHDKISELENDKNVYTFKTSRRVRSIEVYYMED